MLNLKLGLKVFLYHPSTEGTKSMKVEAYCVKCKAKREMKDPKEVKLKNGKPAMKGTCPKCGTGMFRIGKPK